MFFILSFIAFGGDKIQEALGRARQARENVTTPRSSVMTPSYPPQSPSILNSPRHMPLASPRFENFSVANIAELKGQLSEAQKSNKRLSEKLLGQEKQHQQDLASSRNKAEYYKNMLDQATAQINSLQENVQQLEEENGRLKREQAQACATLRGLSPKALHRSPRGPLSPNTLIGDPNPVPYSPTWDFFNKQLASPISTRPST